MGFWSWVGSAVAVVGAAAALATPVGWVAAAAAAIGASAATVGTAAVVAGTAAAAAGTAITALDQINEHSAREAARSEERIEAHTQRLVNEGDAEAKLDLERIINLITDIEKKQDTLATDTIPKGQEAETLKNIQEGIRELRESLVAWTSPLNPHRDKYATVVGSIWERVQNLGKSHERVVVSSLAQTLEAGLQDLNKAGQELSKLSKEEGIELSAKGYDLYRRYNRMVPQEEAKDIGDIEALIKKANEDLENVKEQSDATEKAVNEKNVDDSLAHQKKAEEAKENADQLIVKLIGKYARLKGNTPPSVLTEITSLYTKSPSYQDLVNKNISSVLKLQINAELDKRRKKYGSVDFKYINDKAHEHIDRIEHYYGEYLRLKDDPNQTVKARYSADYAKIYLDMARTWMFVSTGDEKKEWFSWLSTNTAINAAKFFGDWWDKKGFGLETSNICKKVNELAPKVGAATQLSAIAHERRFKGEMDLAFAVLSDNAEMTKQINIEMESARRNCAEKEQKEKEAVERKKKEDEERKKKEDEAKENARIAAKEDDDIELDLPSVPTAPPKIFELSRKPQTQEFKAETKTEGAATSTEDVERSSKSQGDLNPPISDEEKSNIGKLKDKKDQPERESAQALGLSEGAINRKQTKEERLFSERLESFEVEEGIRLRREAIEDLEGRSREAYEVWRGLTDEDIRRRFEEYTTAFYHVYSNVDGVFKGGEKAIKTLESLLDKDFGLYRVHSFLSTWSPLGLARKHIEPTSSEEGILQKLDILYRRCLFMLRENKRYSDELLSLADRRGDSINRHKFEVLADKQKKQAIGLNNFLKEVHLLNKKLPPASGSFTASKSYIGKIRSELQIINDTVEKVKNTLKLLGIEGLDSTDSLSSHPIIPGSKELLAPSYTFPPLSTLGLNVEFEPNISELFDMFIIDFRQAMKSDLSKAGGGWFEEKLFSEAELPSIEEKRFLEELSTIEKVLKDVKRLSPLSSVSKITGGKGGDSSLMLDYEKSGYDSGGSLSDDLEERFRSLSRWRGWVQLPPVKKVKPLRIPMPAPNLEQERNRRNTEERMKAIEFQDLCRPSSQELRIAVDSKGNHRLLRDDENPAANENLDWVEERYVQIPNIEAGDAFNGTVGKKRRIFKLSVRVIDTADIEVGVLGFPLIPIEELRGSPKTGEFDVLVPSDMAINQEIVVAQKTGASFCLTSITAHMQIED